MAVEILKFEADWCGPCKQQATLLKNFDAAPITEVDVDVDQETAQDYEIRGIPTLVLLKDGEEVKRFTGVTQPDKLEEEVETLK